MHGYRKYNLDAKRREEGPGPMSKLSVPPRSSVLLIKHTFQ